MERYAIITAKVQNNAKRKIANPKSIEIDDSSFIGEQLLLIFCFSKIETEGISESGFGKHRHGALGLVL